VKKSDCGGLKWLDGFDGFELLDGFDGFELLDGFELFLPLWRTLKVPTLGINVMRAIYV
jgi:hypothetical protein